MSRMSFIGAAAGIALAHLTKETPLAGQNVNPEQDAIVQSVERKKRAAVKKAQKQRTSRKHLHFANQEAGRYVRQFKEFKKIEARNIASGKWS